MRAARVAVASASARPPPRRAPLSRAVRCAPSRPLAIVGDVPSRRRPLLGASARPELRLLSNACVELAPRACAPLGRSLWRDALLDDLLLVRDISAAPARLDGAQRPRLLGAPMGLALRPCASLGGALSRGLLCLRRGFSSGAIPDVTQQHPPEKTSEVRCREHANNTHFRAGQEVSSERPH
jgi:hypothetical protein